MFLSDLPFIFEFFFPQRYFRELSFAKYFREIARRNYNKEDKDANGFQIKTNCHL